MLDLYVPCRKSANSRETRMLVPIVKHLAFLPVAQVRQARAWRARTTHGMWGMLACARFALTA